MKLEPHDNCNEGDYQKWYQAYCCAINFVENSVELVFLAVVVIFPLQLASAVLSSP